jgi:hypothetical protein
MYCRKSGARLCGKMQKRVWETLRKHYRLRFAHFVIAPWRAKAAECPAYVKRYWEIIADRLSTSGWSWGCVARPATA